MLPLYTAKKYSKNYKCVIMKVKRHADFSLKMHQKRLAAGLRQDPLGEFTALPQTLYLDLRGRYSQKGEGKETGGEMRGQKEVTGEGQVGREEMEGRQGKGGQKGRWEGEGNARNLAPTAISKSRRL